MPIRVNDFSKSRRQVTIPLEWIGFRSGGRVRRGLGFERKGKICKSMAKCISGEEEKVCVLFHKKVSYVNFSSITLPRNNIAVKGKVIKEGRRIEEEEESVHIYPKI